MSKQFRIDSIEGAPAMLALGARLAAMLGEGDCLLFDGGLGAGKTTLARGIINALTDETDVPSPTYTLVQTYSAPKIEIWHADLYRLEEPRDVFALGLLDVRDEVISLIEWPERLGPYLPLDALTVRIGFVGEGRSVILDAPDHTDWGDRLERAGF